MSNTLSPARRAAMLQSAMNFLYPATQQTDNPSSAANVTEDHDPGVTTPESNMVNDTPHGLTTSPSSLVAGTHEENDIDPVIREASGCSNLQDRETRLVKANPAMYEFLAEAIMTQHAQLPTPDDLSKAPEQYVPCNAILETLECPRPLMRETRADAVAYTEPKKNIYLAEQPADAKPLNLFTVRQLKSIDSLARCKDFLVAEVDGRSVFVPKARSRFRPNDLVLYLEMHTFVPRGDRRFNMLSKYATTVVEYQGEKGYHQVPQFMVAFEKAQVVNQGFIFPLSEFPEVEKEVKKLSQEPKREGRISGQQLSQLREMDFAHRFGIRMWTPNENQASLYLGPRPIFIRSTDSNTQNKCPNLFLKEKYKYHIFQESVKMDGESMTAYFVRKDSPFFTSLNPLGPTYDRRACQPNGRFGVLSKKRDLHNIVRNDFWDMAVEKQLPEKLAKLDQTIAVMGELVGDGIESNRHKYPKGKRDFFVFSVFDVDKQAPWNPREVEALAAELGLRHVEVRTYNTIRKLGTCHKDLQNRADLTCYEALVYKNAFDGRWFKVLSQRYLDRKVEPPRGGGGSSSSGGQNTPRADLIKLAQIWRASPAYRPDAMNLIWREPTWDAKVQLYTQMWTIALGAHARDGEEAIAITEASWPADPEDAAETTPQQQ